MISLRTSVSAEQANRFINLAARAVQNSLAKLSTGKRINTAGDDPAGLAIATRFKNQVNGMLQARMNADAGLSMVQTAEGGVLQITSVLQRLNSLAIQASNGTLTSSDRLLIQNEVSQLVAEVDRLASVTTFNNIQLLNGSTVVGTASVAIQVNADANSSIGINFTTMTTTSLGINNLSMTTQTLAENAVSTIQSALYKVTTLQSKIGALQNRLQFSADFLDIQRVSMTSALSVIEDTDFATELTNFTQKSMLVQSSTGVLAQNNIIIEKVLSLLGVGK